jgi:hypothetical protein
MKLNGISGATADKKLYAKTSHPHSRLLNLVIEKKNEMCPNLDFEPNRGSRNFIYNGKLKKMNRFEYRNFMVS